MGFLGVCPASGFRAGHGKGTSTLPPASPLPAGRSRRGGPRVAPSPAPTAAAGWRTVPVPVPGGPGRPLAGWRGPEGSPGFHRPRRRVGSGRAGRFSGGRVFFFGGGEGGRGCAWAAAALTRAWVGSAAFRLLFPLTPFKDTQPAAPVKGFVPSPARGSPQPSSKFYSSPRCV